MSTFKAIETRYKGYRFRSRLEARWAVYFDTLGVTWVYEPQGFHLSDGSQYLPDFRLGAYGTVWAEVKSAHAPGSAFDKARCLAKDTGMDTLLLSGVPFDIKLPLANSCGHDGFATLIPDDWKYAPLYLGGLSNGEDREVDKAHKKAVSAALGARFEHGEKGGRK